MRTLPSLLALSVALAASTVAASPRVELALVDRDSGEWAAPVRHRGQTWVEGTPGHRYAVRLTNVTSERLLVVLSVDGVNAITGQTASPAQSGYVLEPWQTTQVDGWRKSMRHVAQFVFTDLPDSYAARTGRPDNVGVIGIAVFEEARRWREPPAIEERSVSKSSAPMRDEARAQSIGTGHGGSQASSAYRTAFERASSTPVEVTQMRYDDRASLVARGVIPWRRPHRDDRPRAFPAGFVPDPPGWDD
ncbi:hypothetical protein [Lysobacter panacisoli]|uniref:Uncharacterized protein n=1 Tax=Lysobacter panacisoli TaxID=1255263 RepID=A0ABP9L3G7_9GAMM|nr:hypothetical protein [Lysobacter panacisoli]